MVEFPLCDLMAAAMVCCLFGLCSKEPEKYWFISAKQMKRLSVANTILACSVVYELTYWMPGQVVAAILRCITAGYLAIMVGSVFKKHKSSIDDDVKPMMLMVVLFCSATAAEVIVTAIGL